MATDTTHHHVEPYAVEDTGRASARCLTHMTVTAERWPTMSHAARGFCCDEGRHLRFVIEISGADLDPIPVMRDLSGLARIIHDPQARVHIQDERHTSAWLWHAGGRVEPLRVALTGVTGLDSDDYATHTWTVTGEDGCVILSVPIRIDGLV